MNIQDIYGLLERFEKSSIAEMELQMEGTQLKLKKMAEGLPFEAEKVVAKAKTPAEAEATAAEETKSVKAPLAGTFYRAASPEAEPFVKEGQKIHKGDVIGIIEAMKLMNEVTAPEDGVVEKVVAQDGHLVAYDQVLLQYV